MPTCANGCSGGEEVCFDIRKWFECKHTQCRRTTILIGYCIECGNHKQTEFLPKRCPGCQGIDCVCCDDDKSEEDED
jgi:hypothetical protein